MNQGKSGFTIVELLVAVVILGVGLLALAAGNGSITRTLNGSRIATVAGAQANERMDLLRAAARDNATPCSSASFTSSASPVTRDGVALTWVVPASGALRSVWVIASYKLGRGVTKVDTLATSISCA